MWLFALRLGDVEATILWLVNLENILNPYLDLQIYRK